LQIIQTLQIQLILSNTTEDLFSQLALPDSPSELYSPIAYTMSMGGKRIRPKLVLTSCGICGGDPLEAQNAAIAVEMLHNFTLIHDDIMDNAGTRRGFQTVHTKWDVPIAILSGDALFALAFEKLTYYGESKKYDKFTYHKLSKTFINASKIVCEGQARDLSFENRNDVSLDEYLLMIEQKTASLLSASMTMGGIVAQSTDKNIEILGKIGMQLGIAFQIQDDLLDAIGDPKKFGKEPGGDIREGKKTYLSILANKLINQSDKVIMDTVLQSNEVTIDDVNTVIDIFQKVGVIQKTKDTIQNLYSNSIELLNYFDNSTYTVEINRILNQLTVREN
jgi:geranylgeranyl diphosphate synthase type II